MSNSRPRRALLTGAAAILIAAALVALVAVMRGSFSDTDGRILATLGAVLLATGVAAAGTELAARGTAPLRARVAIVLAPVGFVLMTYAIWAFAWEGESETPGQLGWTGVIALISALIATSATLLATAPSVRRLAAATGVFAAVGGFLSAFAIWQEDAGDGIAKLVLTAWILTALGFLLVPIVQRWAGTSETGERLLASHGGVELVALRGSSSHPGDVAVRGSLVRGERLVLRTRPAPPTASGVPGSFSSEGPAKQ